MKKITNILDAALPPPPAVADPNQVLRGIRVQPATVDPVHGELFAIGKKPSGTDFMERAGVRSILDFARLCERLSAMCETQDAFLVAWAGWAICAPLFDTPEEVKANLDRRAALTTEHGVKSAGHSSVSFGTYARAYSAASAVVSVASKDRQFPLFPPDCSPRRTHGKGGAERSHTGRFQGFCNPTNSWQFCERTQRSTT